MATVLVFEKHEDWSSGVDCSLVAVRLCLWVESVDSDPITRLVFLAAG